MRSKNEGPSSACRNKNMFFHVTRFEKQIGDLEIELQHTYI